MAVTLTFELEKGANLAFPRFTHAGPGDPPSRRRGLRGDDRHRPRPDDRARATRSSGMIDLLAARERHEPGRGLHALLGRRRPAHLEIVDLPNWVVSFYFPRHGLRVSAATAPPSPGRSLSASQNLAGRASTTARTAGARRASSTTSPSTVAARRDARASPAKSGLGQVDDGARHHAAPARADGARRRRPGALRAAPTSSRSPSARCAACAAATSA